MEHNEYNEQQSHMIICVTDDTDIITIRIIFLVWSKTTHDHPVYCEICIVQPIFNQYETLYPTMRNILCLGEYKDVTKPGNINLLWMAVERAGRLARQVGSPSFLFAINHYRQLRWGGLQPKPYVVPLACITVHLLVLICPIFYFTEHNICSTSEDGQTPWLVPDLHGLW